MEKGYLRLFFRAVVRHYRAVDFFAGVAKFFKRTFRLFLFNKKTAENSAAFVCTKSGQNKSLLNQARNQVCPTKQSARNGNDCQNQNDDLFSCFSVHASGKTYCNFCNPVNHGDEQQENLHQTGQFVETTENRHIVRLLIFYVCFYDSTLSTFCQQRVFEKNIVSRKYFLSQTVSDNNVFRSTKFVRYHLSQPLHTAFQPSTTTVSLPIARKNFLKSSVFSTTVAVLSQG